MALVRPVSKLRDKNGLECDIAAEGFGGTRNIQISGDVVGNETWDGSGNVDVRVEIADNAVDNSCLTDGAVSTSKILDGAVTSEKLDTGAVTNNKLASGAVSTDKIANEAVTLAKISKDAVDTTPTASSNKLVTSGGVAAAIEAATGGGSVVNDVLWENYSIVQKKGDDKSTVVQVSQNYSKADTRPASGSAITEALNIGNYKRSSYNQNTAGKYGYIGNLNIGDSTINGRFTILCSDNASARRSIDRVEITWGSNNASSKIWPLNIAIVAFINGARSAKSGAYGVFYVKAEDGSYDLYLKTFVGDSYSVTANRYTIIPESSARYLNIESFMSKGLSEVPSDSVMFDAVYSLFANGEIGDEGNPVYIDKYGEAVECVPGRLRAGKDALGNIISETYVTNEIFNSNNTVNAVELKSSDDLDDVLGEGFKIKYYRWSASNYPKCTSSGMPFPSGTGFMYVVNPYSQTTYTRQIILKADLYDVIFVRSKRAGVWESSWRKVYLSPRESTDVSSFSTDDERAYTGKAIAEYVNNAIGGNVGGYLGQLTNAEVTAKRDWKPSDWFVAREKGTNVYYTTTSAHTISYEAGDEIYLQSNNELSVKPTTVYEKTNNKVTSVDDSNMHYPTTGAVKSFVEKQISSLSTTYYNKNETDNAITEQIGTLDAEVTGVSNNVDVKVNQSNGKVTGVIVTDRTQEKFDTVNSNIEYLESSITTGLAGKQDTLQWMTNDEVDTLWQEA